MTKTVKSKKSKKNTKSPIVIILNDYDGMVLEREKTKFLNNADWTQDKKWISNRIIDTGLLDRDAVKNLWRSFDYVMDNLEEHNWNRQRELIEFLFNWVVDE